MRKRNALEVTVDSSEPLEDAIRVLGALYGVTLRLAEDGQETSKPTHQPTTKPTERSASAKPRAGAGVTAAGAGKSRRARAARSTGAPSNAEIRSWARQAGVTVSDRGRWAARAGARDG